jgi:hypothetical protein
MNAGWSSLLGLGLVTAALAAETSSSLAADPREMSKDIIAVQVRKQGHTCDKPKSARRDAKLSRPNETAWVLECENATYRIRLTPDMAARIEKMK